VALAGVAAMHLRLSQWLVLTAASPAVVLAVEAHPLIVAQQPLAAWAVVVSSW
jgi:hypothetical protein